MPKQTPSRTRDVKGSLLAYDKAQERSAVAMDDLTELQRKYVEARLSGMIPLQAGKAAGITQPEVNTYRMEKHPKIQKALGFARQQIIEKYDVGRDDVLRGLFDAVQASGNATELVAAWREIGRIVGVYEATKVEVMHKIEDVTIEKLQRLSTKELIELAEGKDFVVESEDDPYAAEYEQIAEVAVQPDPEQLSRARSAKYDVRSPTLPTTDGLEEETEDGGGERGAAVEVGAEDSEDL